MDTNPNDLSAIQFGETPFGDNQFGEPDNGVIESNTSVLDAQMNDELDQNTIGADQLLEGQNQFGLSEPTPDEQLMQADGEFNNSGEQDGSFERRQSMLFNAFDPKDIQR